MNHQCNHPHSHGQGHIKALHAALWIAVIFMIIEVIGGWMANSLALISDALHMFTDVGALLLGLIVSKIAHRPDTDDELWISAGGDFGCACERRLFMGAVRRAEL